jgi:ActR/RegA family two-component response regulator
MILLVTHQEELRNQLVHALLARGHEVAIPRHREHMLTVLKDSKPELVILDLYLSDRSGAENLRLMHDYAYAGAMLVLSGPSMMPIVNVVYASGLRVTRVVQAPADINGKYDLADLESNIKTLLDEVGKRKKCHASIAKRAYELYETEGRQEGHNVQNWLRAEQELSGVSV